MMLVSACPEMSAVQVGRLNVACLVPLDHPSPATVRSCLDAAITRQLPSACARAFATLCPEQDASVWFIRRLDVDVAVDAGLDPRRLAQNWAAELARSLRRTLSGGGQGDVLCFPSRTAYLAQFLRELAEGMAWGKWYYSGFDGLRVLPTNTAVREALCREPSTGEAALRQLANDGRLDTILRILSEADCRIVLEAFCGAAGDSATPEINTQQLQAAWEAWQRIEGLIADPATRHHIALQLYLALQHRDATPSSALLLAIRGFLTLAYWITGPEAGRLLTALQCGDSVAVFVLARGDDAEALSALFRCERRTVIEIAEQLRATTTRRVRASRPQEGETLTTPFGGAFWLLRDLDELDLEICAAGLPEFEGDLPIALVRFLILLKCLGAPRAPRAFFDPVLRKVTGIPELGTEDVRAWAQKVTPDMSRAFQERWAAYCRNRVNSRWLCLRSARRGRLLLLAHGARDIYLRAARSVDELRRALEEHQEQASGDRPEALLCDPALKQILPPTIAGLAVAAWNSSSAATWAAEDAALAMCLERARRPDEDINHLSMAALLRGARSLDLTLSLAARGALRAFAWRLPGFAWSSAGYLYSNFLELTATLKPQAERWLVRLTRPPLHIVLAMTGLEQETR